MCRNEVSQIYNSTSGVNTNEEVEYEHDPLDLDFRGVIYNDYITIEDIGPIWYHVYVANKLVDTSGMIADGVLGLGNDENSIVYEMYKQNIISRPIYSLSYLNSPLVIFDTPNFLDLALFVESNSTIKISEIYKASFEFNGTFYEEWDAEFSSLSSFITGPFEMLQIVYDNLVVYHGCTYTEEVLNCECEGEYPDLVFTIQGTELRVPYTSYLVTVICYLERGYVLFDYEDWRKVDFWRAANEELLCKYRA